jgi:hypothetical protein
MAQLEQIGDPTETPKTTSFSIRPSFWREFRVVAMRRKPPLTVTEAIEEALTSWMRKYGKGSA